MGPFIDSGAGFVLSMICFSPSIEQQKQFYNCKAKDLGVEWCSERIVYVLTETCKQIAYMVKQLNYAWLITEIPV